MERVQELDDDFRPAVAVEVDHLELKMGGDAVGFLAAPDVLAPPEASGFVFRQRMKRMASRR